MRAAFLLGALLGLGLALVGCEAERSPGRTPNPPTGLTATSTPKPATYGPCPLATIDGKRVELGDQCQYVDGELVGVHFPGGWVTAE